jgi:hypothetical protein
VQAAAVLDYRPAGGLQVTETHAVYLAGYASSASVHCMHCQAPIGFYIVDGERVLINLGSVDLHHAHGQCHYCRSEWHFSYSEKPIEVLMRRRIFV